MFAKLFYSIQKTLSPCEQKKFRKDFYAVDGIQKHNERRKNQHEV